MARVKVRSEEERHAMERKVHLMVEVSNHLSLVTIILASHWSIYSLGGREETARG